MVLAIRLVRHFLLASHTLRMLYRQFDIFDAKRITLADSPLVPDHK
jgi:hypothetical protein